MAVIPTRYDRQIADLQRQLRVLKGLQRRERKAAEPKVVRARKPMRSSKPAVPAEIRRYWDRIAAMGCLICGRDAEIAHCHGGSIVERMQEPKAKGRKLTRYHWLVLPLCPTHGREPYPTALDTDVKAWELMYGRQANFIDRLVAETGIDVWQKAKGES